MIDQHSLSPTTRRLHWLLAVAIIVLSGMGLYMANTESFQLYPIHKSLGVVVLVVAIIRAIWRALEGWPRPAARIGSGQRHLARVVHWMLLVVSLALPITGMIASGASGHGFGIFGWILLPANPDPSNSHAVEPLSAAWAGFGFIAHTALGYLLVVAIVLHAAAALKHHWCDRDRTLLRMLGRP